ncbi:hypothetical protein G4B88_005732 [Cannabis sativa]|uniref:Uncharacterized protein n=1 Tax=Cannabis sativa TaxID=3483 RepID=A0A7J6GSP4_CANSA|nr:hypothetical protein G4B88_005732 [Cannabis sativa]
MKVDSSDSLISESLTKSSLSESSFCLIFLLLLTFFSVITSSELLVAEEAGNNYANMFNADQSRLTKTHSKSCTKQKTVPFFRVFLGDFLVSLLDAETMLSTLSPSLVTSNSEFSSGVSVMAFFRVRLEVLVVFFLTTTSSPSECFHFRVLEAYVNITKTNKKFGFLANIWYKMVVKQYNYNGFQSKEINGEGRTWVTRTSERTKETPLKELERAKSQLFLFWVILFGNEEQGDSVGLRRVLAKAFSIQEKSSAFADIDYKKPLPIDFSGRSILLMYLRPLSSSPSSLPPSPLMVRVFCSTETFTSSLLSPGMSTRRWSASSVSFASHPRRSPDPAPREAERSGFSMRLSIRFRTWLRLLVGENGSNTSVA